MYQTIDEAISVIGIFEKGKFTPKKFKWQERVFPIDQLCSIHDFRDGAVKKRRFSLQSGPTIYLIEFNRDRETWTLQQIWVE